jgi:mannose-6-phosphate isomerase-like protein (cupin superfamily)
VVFSKSASAQSPHYSVKHVEPVMTATRAQARIFTLGPRQTIPWHLHSEVADHYFVLRGDLTITTRDPDSKRELRVGEHHRITMGTAHLLSNPGAIDCKFLLLQGGGNYDWIEA